MRPENNFGGQDQAASKEGSIGWTIIVMTPPSEVEVNYDGINGSKRRNCNPQSEPLLSKPKGRSFEEALQEICFSNKPKDTKAGV